MTAPRAGRAPDVPWRTAVDGLRRAAALLDPRVDELGTELRDEVVVDLPRPRGIAAVRLPGDIALAMCRRLTSVAASIEVARSLAGRAVTHDLELAGGLLGEDLLHPDPGEQQT